MNIQRWLKKNLHTIFIVIALGAIVCYFLTTREGFESRPSSFNDDIASGKKVVWFYAPWCGHCKTMHKDWDDAASAVNIGENHMIKINVGNKDNDEHSKIAGLYNVQGFPTILLLNNGQREEEYNGERSKAAFISYCKEKGLVV
tara:strand:+ start:261 stop:692 length:432 start_codon:yes stop_codon:yes gene_type:complete